jgi:diguanylate cyclase (GGDEF)-like protein/PAS domain S-box-containing protein
MDRRGWSELGKDPLFDAIVESSDDAIYSKDADAVVRTWNRGAEALYGYRAEEIVGRNVRLLVPPERVAEERLVLSRVLSGERVGNVLTERISRDGTRLQVSLTLAPVRGDDGSILGAAVTARDVGNLVRARRQAEAAAAVSHALAESRFDERTLLSLVARQVALELGDSCAMTTVDDDGSFGDIVHYHDDPTAIDLLEQLTNGSVGLATEGLVGKVLADGHPLRIEVPAGQDVRSVADERYHPYLDRFPVLTTMIVPLRNEGHIVGLMGIARGAGGPAFTDDDESFAVDLAERAALAITNVRLYRSATEEIEHRQKAERDLRESEAQFRRLAENAPVVIFRYDVPHHRLEYVSPAINDLLGYQPEDLYEDNQLIFGLADEEDAERSLDYYRHLDDQTRPLVAKRRHRDGRIVWIETRAVSIFDDAGKLAAIEGITADITAMKLAEEELVRHASHDDLTGLGNRTLFLDHVNLALSRRPDHRDAITVLFMDLDRFKVINDSLGHAAGDLVLQQAAERLRLAVRAEDTVARLGGDEFAVLIDHDAEPDTAIEVAERILDAFRQPFDADRQAVHSTVSIGIAHADADSPDVASDVLRHADAALYLAKGRGRDRFELFDDDLRSRLHERLRSETELRRAIEHDEFAVHYQPVFDVRSGKMMGVEALARWNHPERGTLPAGEFIELLEESGLIAPVGELVLAQACDQLRAWRSRGYKPMIAVNLSAEQLNDPSSIDALVGIVRARCVDPSSLCLEITETALMRDPVASAHGLDALQRLGVRLAVDDFGTGYSSLSHLQQFKVDIVKVDKSFVDGVHTDGNDRQIVRAIISLAHALELTAIAEGVETAEQLDALAELGCDLAQGYHLGRPVPAGDLSCPGPASGARS